MNKYLKNDAETLGNLLWMVSNEASEFLNNINQQPVARTPRVIEKESLPEEGVGALKALEEFNAKYKEFMTGSTGPRYFGFVTGGSTPASVVGDWLVSTYDQNATGRGDSSASYIEEETVGFIKELLNLPNDYSGTFVTGATMANFVSLALGRQWAAHQLGINMAIEGLYNMPSIKVLSATPHSSILKALSMLGMGRNSVEYVNTLPNREAVDIKMLESILSQNINRPCIVVANAGTVNTVDYDDIREIAKLKEKYSFWLHVDAAFGGFAACSPKYKHLIDGIEYADSITVDAHKWLNVPYDSAVQFTRHRNLQIEVFQNNAAYLGDIGDNPDFVHLTPENSRRLRALPAWFTIKAYGRKGYQEIVERNCELAQMLSKRIVHSNNFKLLSETRLNVVCFTLSMNSEETTLDLIQKYLKVLRENGKVFLTQTIYKGTPGIRAAICNWRTDDKDMEITWQAMQEALKNI